LSLSENSTHQKQQQQQQHQQLNKQTTIQFDYEQKVSLSPTSGACSGRNEAESRRFLTSPTNLSKSSVYNWKKWKKGQVWRYNSSSNLSETNSTSAINENSNQSFNNGHSNNSSFSNEKAEEDYLSSSYGLQQGTAKCNYPGFGDLESSGGLQAWSSASNIIETGVGASERHGMMAHTNSEDLEVNKSKR